MRAQDGYPPIEDCSCPVCRTPVPDMKPIEPPSVPPVGINISSEEVNTAVQVWENSDRSVPLSVYIWISLCEKYPDYNTDILIVTALMIDMMIRMGVINPRPNEIDNRFAAALNRWR